MYLDKAKTLEELKQQYRAWMIRNQRSKEAASDINRGRKPTACAEISTS